MAPEIVQANYEELDKIAAQFGRGAAAAAQLRQRMQRSFEPLAQGGWQGRGADAFAKEMTATVLPTIERMARAMEAGRAVTLEIKGVMQRAEEEAAARFKQRGDAGALPDLVTPPAGAFDGKRQSYKVGTPSEVASHTFQSGNAAAMKYEVTIDGKAIPVYMPKPPSATGNTHSVEEVAKALAALPPEARKVVTHVNVSPAQNPKDADWEKVYNRPGFRSYMTAGAGGVVDIYPSTRKVSQDNMDKSIHHEVGHTVSGQKWGLDTTDARWNDWKSASTNDGSAPSKYAQVAPTEDFAETYALYYQVKGTPAEADARQRFPNRFQVIDDVVAGKR